MAFPGVFRPGDTITLLGRLLTAGPTLKPQGILEGGGYVLTPPVSGDYWAVGQADAPLPRLVDSGFQALLEGFAYGTGQPPPLPSDEGGWGVGVALTPAPGPPLTAYIAPASPMGQAFIDPGLDTVYPALPSPPPPFLAAIDYVAYYDAVVTITTPVRATAQADVTAGGVTSYTRLPASVVDNFSVAFWRAVALPMRWVSLSGFAQGFAGQIYYQLALGPRPWETALTGGVEVGQDPAADPGDPYAVINYEDHTRVFYEPDVLTRSRGHFALGYELTLSGDLLKLAVPDGGSLAETATGGDVPQAASDEAGADRWWDYFGVWAECHDTAPDGTVPDPGGGPAATYRTVRPQGLLPYRALTGPVYLYLPADGVAMRNLRGEYGPLGRPDAFSLDLSALALGSLGPTVRRDSGAAPAGYTALYGADALLTPGVTYAIRPVAQGYDALTGRFAVLSVGPGGVVTEPHAGLAGGVNAPFSEAWNANFANYFGRPCLDGSILYTAPAGEPGGGGPGPPGELPEADMAQDRGSGLLYLVGPDLSVTVRHGWRNLGGAPQRTSATILGASGAPLAGSRPALWVDSGAGRVSLSYLRRADNRVAVARSLDGLRTAEEETVGAIFSRAGGYPCAPVDTSTGITYVFSAFPTDASAPQGNQDLLLARLDAGLDLLHWADGTTERTVATGLAFAGRPSTILNHSDGAQSLLVLHGDRRWVSHDGGEHFAEVS